MRTILDDSRTWFLHGLAYAGVLKIVLTEGIVGTIPEDLKIGTIVLENTFPIQTTPNSQQVLIQFSKFFNQKTGYFFNFLKALLKNS